MCLIVYHGDQLSISLQIVCFMTTVSMATRCPDTKWISGILDLSLVRGACLAAVCLEPFSGAQESEGRLPRAQRGMETVVTGEEPSLDHFY